MRTPLALSVFLTALPLAAVAAPPLPTEPAAPPPPAKFDVTIRYSIDAVPAQRVPRFRAMLDYLKKYGFTRDEARAPEDEEENRAYTTLVGTVPGDKARALLTQRDVRALRLVPAGTALPAPDAPVRVQLELAAGPRIVPGRHLYDTATLRQIEMDGGADLQRQQLFADEVRRVVAKLGFVEAVGYDNRAHTRLLGTIPAGRLDALLNDLRLQPEAWRLEVEGLPRIDSVLLAGLRNRPGGEVVLDGILTDWEAFFERKKRELGEAPKGEKSEKPELGPDVIAKLVAAWAKQPAAVEYLKGLPDEVRASGTITRGLLLTQLVRHPDSTAVLSAAWKDALASPYAPDLLALVLRRLPRAVQAELPVLLRTDSPVRVTEVQTHLPAVAAPLKPAKPPKDEEKPNPSEPPKAEEKLTPDLLARLGGADANTPLRLDVILTLAPDENDRGWRRELFTAAPGIVIEGRVGPLVTVKVLPGQVRGKPDAPGGLAALPIVSTIRLPRTGQPRVLGAPAGKVDAAKALEDSGLARLHKAKLKGDGVTVAIIDGDFRGWDTLVGKGLPARTHLFDLTAERNVNLLPDAPPAGAGLGHGTEVARAAALAAPGAELVLVRIDPEAPYQMLTVARALNGEAHRSLNLARRADELEDMRLDLESRRTVLHKTRAAQMEKAPDVTQKPLLLKKKEKGTLTADEEDLLKDIEEFEAYKKDQAKLDADEREYQARVQRQLRIEEELRNLRRVRVVATGLAWNEGLPVDGGGALSRYFDDEPFKKAVWFQAGGDTRGQAWAGLFRDRDHDGVMEFLPSGTYLPQGRWSPSLAFLAWQPAAGPAVADLPAGTQLRFSVQWREPHDPDFLRHGQDVYRRPLAAPRLRLLRQLDPTGAKQPADDFQVVAQTAGLPQRLDNQPDTAVYEQTVEFTVAQAGRYALLVEGSVPASVRPADKPTVPAAERTWELRPRVFINTLSGAGRVVLADFATAEGSVGSPADARQPITVGAADAAGKPLPGSASGSAFGAELLAKPTVLSPAVGGGAPESSLSAGFAAGLAATALSAGAQTEKFLMMMGTRPGESLRVPPGWPRR
jgi:hypothetical protein